MYIHILNNIPTDNLLTQRDMVSADLVLTMFATSPGYKELKLIACWSERQRVTPEQREYITETSVYR